jgi:hypothetical protein
MRSRKRLRPLEFGPREVERGLNPLYLGFLLLDSGIGSHHLGLNLVAGPHVDKAWQSRLHQGDYRLIRNDLIADMKRWSMFAYGVGDS